MPCNTQYATPYKQKSVVLNFRAVRRPPNKRLHRSLPQLDSVWLNQKYFSHTTGTSEATWDAHVQVFRNLAEHLRADISLFKCQLPQQASGPVLIKQWTRGYMTTVYLHDTSYTGLSNSKRMSCVQKHHLYSANYKIKYMPYCSDDNNRSLQNTKALYGITPCRETGTAIAEPTQVISPLSPIMQ